MESRVAAGEDETAAFCGVAERFRTIDNHVGDFMIYTGKYRQEGDNGR